MTRCDVRSHESDPVDDAVLAGLIALKGEQAAEERCAGEVPTKSAGLGVKYRETRRKMRRGDEGHGGFLQ